MSMFLDTVQTFWNFMEYGFVWAKYEKAVILIGMIMHFHVVIFTQRIGFDFKLLH